MLTLPFSLLSSPGSSFIDQTQPENRAHWSPIDVLGWSASRHRAGWRKLEKAGESWRVNLKRQTKDTLMNSGRGIFRNFGSPCSVDGTFYPNSLLLLPKAPSCNDSRSQHCNLLHWLPGFWGYLFFLMLR